MNVSMRLAAPGDEDEIRACVDAAYRHYIPRMGRQPGPMLADYTASIAHRHVWIAEEEGSLAGLIVLMPADDYLLLDNIAVDPAAQGKGIGRQLLDLADREARRQEFAELRLYTHIKMTENISLYRYLGWEETGRGEQDGYERVFFRRTVPTT